MAMRTAAVLLNLAFITVDMVLCQIYNISHPTRDTMTLGSRLTKDQFLVSRNGTYVLGFFSFFSNVNYIGIWFAVSPRIKVWVANRDSPAGNNAFLELANNGSLILCNGDGTAVWKAVLTGNNVEKAAILDTGNLVLQSNLSKEMIAWQSFDSPTDTWLPGMHLGSKSSLISWQSTKNPGSGRFSLTVRGGNEMVSLWKSSVQYWSGGVWNTNQRLYTVSSGTLTYTLNVTLHNDTDNPFFSYLEEGWHLVHETLEEDGILRSYAWNDVAGKWFSLWSNPGDECQVERVCGPNGLCNSDIVPFCTCPPGLEPADPRAWKLNDWSLGCIRSQPLVCKTDQFIMLNNTYFGSQRNYYQSQSENQRWCENECLQDCSCTGYAYSVDNLNDCILYDSSLCNGRTSSNNQYNFFLRVAGSRTQPRNRHLGSVISIIACFVIAFLALGGYTWLSVMNIKASTVHETNVCYSGVVKYSYKSLRKATKNFSKQLGTGGFGTVYEGKLIDNSLVAVKKLDNDILNQGEKQFRAEVSIIGALQHINLVLLRGYCAEGGKRLLVYEHLSNGSLDKHLFAKHLSTDKQALDWKVRFDIALGTARGIAYLHEECRNCIIHCDIKPENIVLNANFCAKLSDFGLAKLFGHEVSHVITTTRGTRGYLAPEWLENTPITVKADVYSYGMTLLELISGRRNINAKADLDTWYFPFWAYNQMKLANYSILVDEKLVGNFNLQQLKVCVLVALWCIQDEVFLRPTMSTVVNMLEGFVEITEPPIPKSLMLLGI